MRHNCIAFFRILHCAKKINKTKAYTLQLFYGIGFFVRLSRIMHCIFFYRKKSRNFHE